MKYYLLRHSDETFWKNVKIHCIDNGESIKSYIFRLLAEDIDHVKKT
jgi:hypothetical protein